VDDCVGNRHDRARSLWMGAGIPVRECQPSR